MNQSHRSRSSSRGFTLVEALVALLVLSFGMLAIAGFQSALSRSSDLAKQRTEAMRLAQQKMESLRAYGQVASSTATPHLVNYTDDVVSSTTPEIFTSNATFSRTWTVTASSSDTEKWINVQVAWTDRAGQPQTVQLLSVISKFDPQDIGTLATGTGATSVRRPKNRNINIPYPAVTLSDRTKSAFMPPPGDIAYVFDNTTGNIVLRCTGLSANAPTPVPITTLTRTGTTVTVNAPGHSFVAGYTVAIAGVSDPAFIGQFTVVTATVGSTFTYTMASPPLGTSATGGTATRLNGQLLEGLDIANSGANCTDLDAYLLSGYVRFDTGNNPTGAEPVNPGSNNNTLPLLATSLSTTPTTMPLSLEVSNAPTPSTGGDPSMVCFAQRQKVVSTTNTTPVAITSVSRSDRTVTVNAPGHAFVAGQTVAINGTSDPAYIGAFVIASATAGSSFTYTLPPPLPTGATATGGTAALVERLTIADGATVPGYTNVVSLFVAYTCVVTPVNHDGADGTAKRWWGRVTLNPNTDPAQGTVWAIGTASTQYKVCRYSADYNASGTISNSEHPQWYRGVTGPLDSQNYLVIKGTAKCPTDKPQDLLGNPVNVSDDTTAQQQPTSGAVLSFQCPSGGCAGGNPPSPQLEPTNTATDLLMD